MKEICKGIREMLERVLEVLDENCKRWTAFYDEIKEIYEELDSVKFPQKLIEIREKYGLTQQQLADLLGVSLRTIQRWERAESWPQQRHIFRLTFLLKQWEREKREV